LEMLLFTMVGVILYVTSDAIVKAIEKRKGEPLPNRSIIFFAIITVLALVVFNLLQNYGAELGLISTPQPTEQLSAPTPNSPQPH